MKDFITIAIFHLPQETYILKTLLERENIAHFFENETIVSVDPFASIALGGIKLKVHPDDQERTQQLIDDLNNPLHIV
ncbi:MAG: hypothetical protein RLZZ500_1906 [Bacteroidota bacterium]|jgi:hypothetical protein